MECLLVWKSRSSKKKIPGSFSQTGEIYYRLIRNQRLVAYSSVNSTLNPNDQVVLAPLMVDSYRNLDVEVNNSCGVVRVPEVIIVSLGLTRCTLMCRVNNLTIVETIVLAVVYLELNTVAVLLQSLELTGKVSHNLLRVNSNKVNYIVLVEIDRCMR